MIYEYIVSNGQLTALHRDELIRRRGFSEATVADCRFISGGQHMLSLEESLISTFQQDELIDTGAFVANDKGITISPILLEDRIIIPYLDKQNKAYFIRPHKLGLKGAGIEIYQRKNINGKSLVLTEGEFKAAACVEMGYPCIAVPGISSFSTTHLHRLVKLLTDAFIRDIFIVFDNEVKDDSINYPKRFKRDPMDRYDTQYYAVVMAKSLEKEGFNTFIATLPAAWMVDGKIDIDGALAQDKTMEDMKVVLQTAVNWKDYLRELPASTLKIVKKKLDRKFFRNHVHKEFNTYHAVKGNGKSEYSVAISNFTIKVKSTTIAPSGMTRDIAFFQENSPVRISQIESDQATSVDKFKTFCFNNGDYLWWGGADDLAAIWAPEFLESDGRIIYEHPYVGWSKEGKLWIYQNVAIDSEGTELRPDNGVFWQGDKGTRPISISVDKRGESVSRVIPTLSLTAPKFTIDDIISKFADVIGINQAKLIVGWQVATLFMEEIYALYHAFPFLFIAGKKGSGKSSVAFWLTGFSGDEQEGLNIGDTSPVGIQRLLSYYSCLPVYVDEFRNESKLDKHISTLRSAYNRQSAAKGIKESFGMRSDTIRGALLIAGEDPPRDPALLSRCIQVVVRLGDRKGKPNPYNWFMKHRLQFSYFTYQLLKQRKKLIPDFMEALAEAKEHLAGKLGDDRLALHHGICFAGLCILCQRPDREFQEWIETMSTETVAESESVSITSTFWDELLTLNMQGQLDNYWDVDNGFIYLPFKQCYDIWVQFKARTGSVPFSEATIRGYMKEEPGYIDMNISHRIKGHVLRCIRFFEENAPNQLKELVSSKPTATATQNSASK